MPAQGDATLLLVDDDPDLLRLLSIRLKANGYAVHAVDSGARALAAIGAARPDLVLTDLRMNGMDGMALFQEIQASYPGLPVIILTAHGTIPDAVAAVKRGVFGYLTKPYDPDELLGQIGAPSPCTAGKGALGRRAASGATRSSRAPRSWRTCSPRRSAWPRATRASSSRARAARARSSSRAPSTARARARATRSSRSTAARFPRRCSRASSSAT